MKRLCQAKLGVTVLALATAMAAGGVPGRAAAQARTSWEGRGVVRQVRAERSSVVIRHEEIVGLMRPMTMPFRVRDVAMLEGVSVGDTVTFTVTRRTEGGYVLTRLTVVPARE